MVKLIEFKKYWLCVTSLVITFGAFSTGAFSLAYEDDPDGPAEVGLNGLLSAFAPEGLTQDDFKKLAEEIDNSWKPWAFETGDYVKELYEGEHATVESQRAALQAVRIKLKTMEKSLKDERYRSIHKEVAPLYLNLSAKIDLYEAVLNTVTMDPQVGVQGRLSSAYVGLRNAVSSLRSEMARVNHGQQWLTWVEADALSKLNANDAHASDLINKIADKMASREDFSDEIQTFLSRESFLRLEDRLNNIQLLTKVGSQKNSGVLRELLGELLISIEEYEDEPSSEKELALRKLFNQVSVISPDGGAQISQVMQAHYLNYNLHLYVSEGLLNRFIAESRQDSSWINECIMEARVTGYQCTNSNISVDIQPSYNNALFTLNLDGNVNANTQGSTHQATIATRGYHTFNGTKTITFDGYDFRPSGSRVGVNANSRTVGATTKFSWIPIVGRIANNIAFNEAESRGPQINALTENKIRTQVRKSLDEEVDKKFAEASLELQANRYGPLRQYGMFPDTMQVSSTSSEIVVHSRLMLKEEIGGSRTAPNVTIPRNGLVVQVHESLLTNGSERLDLHGKTMTESELRDYLEDRFSKILGRKVEVPSPEVKVGEEAAENTLVFDEIDPLRFVIENGQVELRMRTGLKREGADDIPVQEISVPFEITLNGDKVALKRGNVGVKPISRPPSIAEQVTRANVMRQNIQKSLGDKDFDSTFDLEQQGKTLRLQITKITAEEGWLNISLR